MNVLFVTRKFPPVAGGMELLAYEMSEALRAKVNVRLIAWSGEGRLRAILVALPILTMRAGLALMRERCDVIHLQDGLLAPIGWLLSRLFRRPYIVLIHGLDATYANPIFRGLVFPALRRADKVVCISSAAAEAARNAGVPAAKIQIIPLVVNDKLYGTADRKTLLHRLDLPQHCSLLLTVGRLIKRKGVAWFIDTVLPRIVHDFPDVIYLVAGEGEDRSAIEAAVERQALEAHVRLLGRIDDELHAAAYNGADVFVMPNIKVVADMEGFGLVLLEAALCERPIVAAALEGIKDAVHAGLNAVLVPSGDAAAFTEAIGTFLSDPAAARQFGRQSRDYTLQHYSWDALSTAYANLYESLRMSSADKA